jgi:high affinity sulfate transporter 1
VSQEAKTAGSGSDHAGRLARLVPATAWLRGYQPAWLGRDSIAGFTIWGLLIPEMIAYASLAGLTPQAGLYTLLASLGLYAIFGTSRQLVVAGTSASAVLVFSTVTDLHPKNATQYAALAATMILITGALFLIAGVCRLGFITEFLSRPVMSGFVFGLAIFVTVSQLPKLFGIEKGEGDSVRQFIHLVANLGHTSVTTLAVGALALAALFALERWAPKVPGGLVILVAAIVISAALHLSRHGVDTVGHIPTGLPTVSVPRIKAADLWALIPSAAGMMLVIFSEALGAGQTFADKNHYRLDPDQEMVAIGLANVGSGLLGGLAAGGSLSQTAVNDGAEARSQVSSLVAAILSLVTVLALTPLFTDLPEAVLAALIIHAVSHLMKVGEMRRYHQLIPREFWLGMLTLVAVITLDVLPALIIGVVASILMLVYRASRPYLSVLGALPDEPDVYADVVRRPEAEPIPGVLIVRPNIPVFYANAQAIQDRIRALTAQSRPPAHTVLLDLDANDGIDITSVEALAKLATALEASGVRLVLVHLHGPAEDIAARAGLLEHIPAGGIQPNLATAVAWARTVPGH